MTVGNIVGLLQSKELRFRYVAKNNPLRLVQLLFPDGGNVG